jgi:hypothetical protein
MRALSAKLGEQNCYPDHRYPAAREALGPISLRATEHLVLRLRRRNFCAREAPQPRK